MTTTTKNISELFQTWLERSDDIVLPKSIMEIPRSFSIDITGGDSQVSGQNTIGSGNGAQSASANGKKLEKATKDGDKDMMVKLLTDSPANAVSSILGLAQSRTDWNPLSQYSDKNEVGFQNFIKEILKVPFFNITQSEVTDVKYKEENYNSLIDKVTGLYTGILEKDKNKIKDSIVSLAIACTSSVNTENTRTLFVQNTLNAPEDNNIVVGIQQTFMMMERSHSSGKGAPKDKYKTEIRVKVLELTFQSNLWNKRAAESLANVFIKSWDDWLSDTTTPPAPSYKDIKYCFGNEERMA